MSDRDHTAPTHDDIARLAYDRYLARGGADGSDVEDWLAAEQEARLRHAGIPDGASTMMAGDSAAAPAGVEGDAVETRRRRGRQGNSARPARDQGSPQVAM